MKVKKAILKKADGNPLLLARLIEENKSSYPSVKRWIRNNHKNLTTATSLKVFCEVLNLTQEEILE
jgi:hypothetical protein